MICFGRTSFLQPLKWKFPNKNNFSNCPHVTFWYVTRLISLYTSPLPNPFFLLIYWWWTIKMACTSRLSLGANTNYRRQLSQYHDCMQLCTRHTKTILAFWNTLMWHVFLYGKMSRKPFECWSSNSSCCCPHPGMFQATISAMITMHAAAFAVPQTSPWRKLSYHWRINNLLLDNVDCYNRCPWISSPMHVFKFPNHRLIYKLYVYISTLAQNYNFFCLRANLFDQCTFKLL